MWFLSPISRFQFLKFYKEIFLKIVFKKAKKINHFFIILFHLFGIL